MYSQNGIPLLFSRPLVCVCVYLCVRVNFCVGDVCVCICVYEGGQELIRILSLLWLPSEYHSLQILMNLDLDWG